MLRQCLKCAAGLECSDPRQRISALSLELVEVAPLVKVREVVHNRAGDDRNRGGVAEQAQFKDDIFVAFMSALAEKTDQKRRARSTLGQRIQCGT